MAKSGNGISKQDKDIAGKTASRPASRPASNTELKHIRKSVSDSTIHCEGTGPGVGKRRNAK